MKNPALTITRVAIIGLGAVTHNIHLPAYARLPERVQIVAGCDPNPEARALAERSGRFPAVYSGVEEMIEKTRPEVVIICTPPAAHSLQTIQALAAGCHVFCEKPMAEDLHQAKAIIRAAEQANRRVVVNTQFPCMQIYRAAKALIGSQEFGRLLFIQAWQQMHPSEQQESGWRSEMERRVCFEFGVHVFALIRYFFDDTPIKVFAHMPQPSPQIKSDAVNTIALEFADGRAASILLNRLSKGPERYLEMNLDGEFASIHTAIGSDLRLELGVNPRQKRPFLNLHLVKGGKAILQRGNRARTIAREGINPFASATAAHFESMLNAIERGAAPPGEAKDNLKTLALALAAYDSARTGREIEVSRYLEPQVAAVS